MYLNTLRKDLNFKGLNIKEHGVTHNDIENYANFLNEVIIFFLIKKLNQKKSQYDHSEHSVS